ncbi:MAG: hypothetical protein AB8I08_17240 [Sandaracinaceae bacterium]
MTPLRAASPHTVLSELWRLCRACGLPAHLRYPLTLALVIACAGCPTVTGVMPPLAVASPLAPNRGSVEGRLRGAALTGLSPADAAPSASMHVPRGQVDGALSVRIAPVFTFRFVGGAGLDVGALAVGARTTSAPDRAAWFGGVLPTFHISLDGETTGLNLGPEFRVGVMPSQYFLGDSCEDGVCSGSSSESFDVMPILGGHASLWHEPDRHVRLYLGLGIRNHPSADGTFGGAPSSYSSFGFLVFLPSAGVEVSFTEEVGMAAEVQWIAAVAPVVFYPTVGVSVFARFGEGTLAGRGQAPEDPIVVPRPRPTRRTLHRIPGG